MLHTLISHAGATTPSCEAMLPKLALPNLDALLRLLSPLAEVQGDPRCLSPLHEQLQAQALGLVAADGLIPWAARDAHAAALPPASAGHGWARITLCHWQVQADHVEMPDPADLAITAAESDALLQAMRGYFEADGITLHGWKPGTWLASGAVFHGLSTASLERVRAGTVDPWIPRQPQAQSLRRLQNEMQMLLYTHPLNDDRAARGLRAINAFWVSGTGALNAPNGADGSGVRAIDHLGAAARRDGAAAWAQAWMALDQGVLADLRRQAQAGSPTTLTLCGEQRARTFTLQQEPFWTRLRKRLTAVPAHTLLHSL